MEELPDDYEGFPTPGAAILSARKKERQHGNALPVWYVAIERHCDTGTVCSHGLFEAPAGNRHFYILRIATKSRGSSAKFVVPMVSHSRIQRHLDGHQLVPYTVRNVRGLQFVSGQIVCGLVV